MRAEVSKNSEIPANSRNLPTYASPRSGPNTPRLDPERDEEDDHQSAWAREEQQVHLVMFFLCKLIPNHVQLMMREQDRTIDSIAGTLSTLAQQAGLMGQEIGEHNE